MLNRLQILLSVLVMFLLSGNFAHAELRKRVHIVVNGNVSKSTRDIVRGGIAREVGKYRDVLVIDESYDQSFLRNMKYKAHVVVKADILQNYLGKPRNTAANVFKWIAAGSALLALSADDPNSRSNGSGNSNSNVPWSIAAASGLMWMYHETGDPVDGHFVANITLSDMTTQRTFARTQVNHTVKISIGSGESVETVVNRVAAKYFKNLGKWVHQKVKKYPGQTWVFGIDQNRVFINAGTLDGVRSGQKLKLYRPYNIKSPGTNRLVGMGTEYEGQVRIVQLHELHSIAEPVDVETFNGEYITK